MSQSSHNKFPASSKKGTTFPGAVAKSPHPDQTERALSSAEIAERDDESAFVPILDDDASAIIGISDEISVGESASSQKSDKDGEDSLQLQSAEGVTVAPEPVLDWNSLERKQGEGEDDRVTVSSASVEGVSASVGTDDSAHSDEEMVSGSASSAEVESPSNETVASVGDDVSIVENGSTSNSNEGESESCFPGAVASPHERVSSEPEVPSTPWWKRIPTWKQMVTSSSISFVVALVILFASLSFFRVGPNDDTSGLDIFSEVLSSVLNPGTSERVFQGKERLNILCLGIDYNRDEKGMGYTAGARSDTMFVLSLNPDGTILNVLSIPRDTYVYLGDGIGYDKINAAYSYGGIDLAKTVVSNFLGIPIHKYIIIKVAGAFKMVDALGGLQINVEKDMDYDDNWGQLHIHLRAGNQLLKGEEAVGYARFRMDEESDRGRIRRQQQTMQALLQRLKDPMVILRLQAIIKAVKENVLTDLSVLDMLDLAYLYKDFDRQHMKTGTLVGDDVEVNGVSVIMPYEAENRKIVAELFSNNSSLQREQVRVQVLNGSGDEELANELARTLTQEGFIVTQGEADRDDYEVTQVVDHLGSVSMRTAIVNLIRGCQYEVYEQSENLRSCEYTVIVGRDRRQINQPTRSSQYETIIIDRGNDAPSGYVDSGDGLSNENHQMPFTDEWNTDENNGSPEEEHSESSSGSQETPGMSSSVEYVPATPPETHHEAPAAHAPEHAPAAHAPEHAPATHAPAPAPEPAAPAPAPAAEPAPAPEPEPAAPAPAPEPAPSSDTEDVLPAPVAL